MNSKILGIGIITCLLIGAQFCQTLASDKADDADAEKNSAIQIYLPREITIKDDTIYLGQVSIIRGEESLVSTAGKVTLGHISVPGQQIIVDRTTILSRLACSGVPLSKVKLTGAEKIKVKKQQRIIKGSEFVELAGLFLKKNPLTHLVCQWNPIRTPKDLTIVGGSKDVQMVPHLAKSGAINHAKVRIAVLADGKEIDVREVTFRLKYNYRRAVALVDIPAGASITPKNVKIEKTPSNYPEPANWNPPYGLVARRRIPANTTIRSYMVGPVNPVVIIKRNKTVVIQIKMPGLLITAIGKAMQNGRAGDYIKVQNVDSRRIIFARVNKDGTVEPVF